LRHRRLLTADAFAFEPLPATPSCPQLFARGGRFGWQWVRRFGAQLFLFARESHQEMVSVMG
jgi:hypothetical protein